MQAFTVRNPQLPPAWARSSLEISRFRSTVGSCSGGRNSGKEEDVVGNGTLPLRKHVETLPLPAHCSSSLQKSWSWRHFSDAEPNLSLTFPANPPQFSVSLFSIGRLMDENLTSAEVENWVSMGLHKWVAGVFIASSLLLTAPVEAAEKVLSLSMLDSEITTGPITEFLLSRQEQRARDDFSERVSEAVEWLEKGRLAQARGDFSAALNCFNEVTENAGDLALAEYARVGRAVTLYEVGDRGQAIIEMEDVSISLKGYPEIHAALAAALYADKNAPIPAEKQFTIATLLDPRYTDLVWVHETKHWPPSLLKSLQRFISLS